jgi:hydroxyacylglutathione hydrolase
VEFGWAEVPDMLEVIEIPVTPFQQNCTLLICTTTGKAAVCDCGDAAPVLAEIAARKVEVELILATHGHLDHIGGTAALKQALGVPFLFHKEDDFWRLSLPAQAAQYGFPGIAVPEPDGELVHGQRVRIGEVELEVRHCPGHTPGHVVFYDAESGTLIAGDVIFQGSVGRTDFPRGSWPDLERSIQEQVYTLPGETLIHCGHGPTTTVAQEARSNPFVRA